MHNRLWQGLRFSLAIDAALDDESAGELRSAPWHYGVPNLDVKTAESGNPRGLTFCPECGTNRYGTTPGVEDVYSLRLGTARERARLKPGMQVWCRSALPWVSKLEGMREYEQQTGPARNAAARPGGPS